MWETATTMFRNTNQDEQHLHENDFDYDAVKDDRDKNLAHAGSADLKI